MSLVMRSHINLSLYRKNYRNLWTRGKDQVRGFSTSHPPSPPTPTFIFLRVLIAKNTGIQHITLLKKYILPASPLFQVDLRASDWQRGDMIFCLLYFSISWEWNDHVQDTNLLIAYDIRRNTFQNICERSIFD